jgi:hypothetical protein
LGHSDIVGYIFEWRTLVQPFDKGEPLAHLLAISFCEQAVEITFIEVADNLFLSPRHCPSNSEYT